MRICINNRDELHLVELNDVAFMKASGNFTEFHMTNGTVQIHLPCLSDYEARIAKAYAPNPSPFFRTGRSLLINTTLVLSIIMQRQQVRFRTPNSITLELSKPQLRLLKDYISSNN